MEEDDPTPHALTRWVELEYKLAFTNLSSATGASLSAAFPNMISDLDPDSTSASSLAQAQSQAQAECYEQGALALMKSRDIDIPLERVCLLDPKASLALTPSDGEEGKFTWFLFGGTFGTFCMRSKRTLGPRIAMGFLIPDHLGPVQMTTDTALGVTKRVIVDRFPFEAIPYVARRLSHILMTG
ncbi:DUF431-domain-containing protein [Russula emetica]|nr:DUF431-domain-containing protein [Russula emetica]